MEYLFIMTNTRGNDYLSPDTRRKFIKSFPYKCIYYRLNNTSKAYLVIVTLTAVKNVIHCTELSSRSFAYLGASVLFLAQLLKILFRVTDSKVVKELQR